MKKLAAYERKIALRALLYMLYLSSAPFSRVGLADIQGWTGCSKPTIIKHLKELEGKGLVIKSEIKHRPNAVAFLYHISDSAKDSYALQSSKHDYSVYKFNVLGER
jgi:DNA-binding MarR family transcriptional regulator